MPRASISQFQLFQGGTEKNGYQEESRVTPLWALYLLSALAFIQLKTPQGEGLGFGGFFEAVEAA
jgi:hypothetical protein